MAKDSGYGFRIGSVKSRSQFINPRTGLATKRGGDGKFMAVKRTGGLFKGVAKERDGRKA
jgi:hypothetical protein